MLDKETEEEEEEEEAPRLSMKLSLPEEAESVTRTRPEILSLINTRVKYNALARTILTSGGHAGRRRSRSGESGNAPAAVRASSSSLDVIMDPTVVFATDAVTPAPPCP